MQAKSIWIWACAVGIGALAMNALSRGGPLDPPAAPVAPTGATLGEINASVNQLVAASASEPSLTVPVLPTEFMGVIEFLPPPGAAPITGDQNIGPFADAIGVRLISGPNRSQTGGGLSDVVVVKEMDKSTPKLQEAICNGTNFPEVMIHLLRSDAAGARVPYFMIKLTNARVTSYSVSGSASGDEPVPTESVSFNYSKIEWTYTPSGEAFETNQDGCAIPGGVQ